MYRSHQQVTLRLNYHNLLKYGFPEILHPNDEHVGWDYDKVFVDADSYHEGFGQAYKNYGVDKARGCVVAVRPDQYVGWVGDLEDIDELAQYFKAILVEAES